MNWNKIYKRQAERHREERKRIIKAMCDALLENKDHIISLIKNKTEMEKPKFLDLRELTNDQREYLQSALSDFCASNTLFTNPKYNSATIVNENKIIGDPIIITSNKYKKMNPNQFLKYFLGDNAKTLPEWETEDSLGSHRLMEKDEFLDLTKLTNEERVDLQRLLNDHSFSDDTTIINTAYTIIYAPFSEGYIYGLTVNNMDDFMKQNNYKEIDINTLMERLGYIDSETLKSKMKDVESKAKKVFDILEKSTESKIKVKGVETKGTEFPKNKQSIEHIFVLKDGLKVKVNAKYSIATKGIAWIMPLYIDEEGMLITTDQGDRAYVDSNDPIFEGMSPYIEEINEGTKKTNDKWYKCLVKYKTDSPMRDLHSVFYTNNLKAFDSVGHTYEILKEYKSEEEMKKDI